MLQIRLDVHSYGTDRIIVTDPSSGQTTIVTPSNGTCQSRNFGRGINWITEEDNSTLLSTAEMLHFTKANNVTYLPGFQSVRHAPPIIHSLPWTFRSHLLLQPLVCCSLFALPAVHEGRCERLSWSSDIAFLFLCLCQEYSMMNDWLTNSL